ncbi:MAG: cell division protein ZapA [Proteobacteria bacterium]|nr:cell division protein ZapA [Pseudomonadota bacterium]
MKKTTEISIMGQKFMVKSESNDDYVRRIAGFVDQKIEEVMQSTKSVASLNVAILAAMNIADEYFKFKKDRDDRIEKAEKKIKDMIELVDLQL